ncbi:MAG: GWxTD domain-containing protein [Gemmatimonadota bacterium]|nr:MAG: GWxTD domain-containing protein [Gemmatimonadota bacterium]
MNRPLFSLVTLLALASSTAQAQEAAARQHIAAGLTLAAAGDTLAAVAELQKAVKAAPKSCETQYQLGRLLARSASTLEKNFKGRLDAERALRRALECDFENPYDLAELGLLLLKQNKKIDARRFLNRSLGMADEQEIDDPLLLADIHFGLGLVSERLYEDFRDRVMIRSQALTLTETLQRWPSLDSYIDAPLGSAQFQGPWFHRYVESVTEAAMPIEGFGDDELAGLAEHYRAALRYNPTHLEAARRALAHLLETNQLGEYMTIAERLVEAYPDRADGYLYLGLGLHARGQEELAGSAFAKALARLPAAERAAFQNITPVLQPRLAKGYSKLDDTAQAQFRGYYWRVTDPLLITEANERQLEHWARVAYVDLRFTEPATGLRGWETDRGVTFIRYGQPDAIVSDGRTILWYYESGGEMAFHFERRRGYIKTRFAWSYGKWIADQNYHIQSALYDNIPAIRLLLHMPVQIARFRGADPGELAVEVYYEIPFESLADGTDAGSTNVQRGIFLLASDGQQVVREVRSEALEYADASSRNPLRCWRLLLSAAASFYVVVEARDTLSRVAAVAREKVTATPFPEDSLSVSDILVAERLRRLAEVPLSRADFDIVGNPSLEFAPRQPIYVYYELYGLQPDEEGFASYDVSLSVKVKSLDRGAGNPLAILGALADAWGFSVVGDDRLELQFSRQLDMSRRDRATEYHRLELEQAPAGEYEITLKIWGRASQRLATREQVFTVVRDD